MARVFIDVSEARLEYFPFGNYRQGLSVQHQSLATICSGAGEIKRLGWRLGMGSTTDAALSANLTKTVQDWSETEE
jgi:hypothetical protein